MSDNSAFDQRLADLGFSEMERRIAHLFNEGHSDEYIAQAVGVSTDVIDCLVPTIALALGRQPSEPDAPATITSPKPPRPSPVKAGSNTKAVK